MNAEHGLAEAPEGSELLTHEQRFDLCQLELNVVQDNIARFDTNGLQVKTWCATLWTALEAVAVGDSRPRLALMGVVVALIFSCVELSYRRFQWRFIQRSREVEATLEIGNLSVYRYSVHRCAIARNTAAELAFSLKQAHFYSLYLLLSLLSIALWWWL